jgi:hypothetical protein
MWFSGLSHPLLICLRELSLILHSCAPAVSLILRPCALAVSLILRSFAPAASPILCSWASSCSFLLQFCGPRGLRPRHCSLRGCKLWFISPAWPNMRL